MSFAARLLAWFDEHGRKDLPWQQHRAPYRVWVSEIMLQQTQVATVIPYFERFMARFPGLDALAGAARDDVLAHWSGLGYYSRARNLHAAAQQIRDRHGGRFPQTLGDLLALPGIGRSTAGAILAQALGQRHAILDGNVKRVLTRYHALAGWPGKSDVERTLWELAERHTPHTRCADYTQAIMDLGATLCSRKPACARCPLAADCAAHLAGTQSGYPATKPRKPIPARDATLLLVTNRADEVLLVQRPPAGIWGGLWSLPELDPGTSPEAWCTAHLGVPPLAVEPWSGLRHTFSHFHLDIAPVHLRIEDPRAVMEPGGGVWYKTDLCDQLGLPAPIKRLLRGLQP